MSSLGTSKGVLEIAKFGLYVTIPIALMYTFANNTKNIQKFMGNRSYVVYPPEGPRPQSPEELREMARELARKKNILFSYSCTNLKAMAKGHDKQMDFLVSLMFVIGSNERNVKEDDGNKCNLSSSRPASQPRFIQHKQEAFWFYRFLSVVYDRIINPGHWAEDMRDEKLEPANLNSGNLKVVDVGGGTGFTTLGIVKYVNAENVAILDQSPHQLAKARQKEPLKECKIIEGNAEDLHSLLTMPADINLPLLYVFIRLYFLRIEYWPDPQCRIKEAYRVLKIEEEYIEWFKNAGFKDVKLKRIGPKWYRGVRKHGLFRDRHEALFERDSPLKLGPKAENVKKPSFLPSL
ncbi:hypothetical protein GQ457_01G032170 [Hibiscus cannabinus]